jgi:hypothetical protein
MNSKKRKAILRKLKDMPCYLCGVVPEQGELTVDHVPPHGLAPLSPNSDFLLLPSHKSCNNRYSDQEAKFIAYLASVCCGMGNASADAAWNATERGFRRNEIGRAGAPSKDLLRLLENSAPIERYSRNGIYLGSSRVCWPSQEVDVELIIGKIARGLHYHHTKTVVPETWKLTVELGQLSPHYVLQAPIHNSLGDFFAYEGGCDKSGSLWYMSIYRQAYALVRIDDPEQSFQSSEANQYTMRHITDLFPNFGNIMT